jgi:preprotein translocase subunit SecE
LEGANVRKAASKVNQEKKSKPKASPRGRGRKRKENAIVRYFRQTWVELKRVSWPTRREATNLTAIVLAVTVAMSSFLGVVDWLSALFFSLLVEITG